MLILFMDDIKIINFIYAQFSLYTFHYFYTIFYSNFKRKYIFNAFNKKKLYPMKEIHNENNIIASSAKKNNHYKNSYKKYSEFYKRKLRVK